MLIAYSDIAVDTHNLAKRTNSVATAAPNGLPKLAIAEVQVGFVRHWRLAMDKSICLGPSPVHWAAGPSIMIFNILRMVRSGRWQRILEPD